MKHIERKTLIALCIIASVFLGTIFFAAAEYLFVNPTDAEISVPLLSEDKDSVVFTVKNHSESDKSIKIIVKNHDINDLVTSEDEYDMSLPSGMDEETIELPINGKVSVTVMGDNDKIYIEEISIGSVQASAIPSVEPSAEPSIEPSTEPSADSIWVGTWSSAQLTASGDTLPPSPGLAGNTYRQALRVSTGGSRLRITFSNEFGEKDVVVSSIHIAKLLEVGKSKIDTATDTVVTFDGKEELVIPAGGKVTSDVINYTFDSLEYIAVSMHFESVPSKITSHTASRSTNWITEGDHVTDESFKTARTATSWYFLSDIDVLSEPGSKAIACFGDSITDGYGVKANGYYRWTDILANRLQEDPDTQNISVLNTGIGANSIFGGNGPGAKYRFLRDTLEQDGVGYIIVFIGVNDIGYAGSDNSQTIIDEYKVMIQAAHDAGVKIYGGTITPFKNNGYYSALHEKIRQTVNAWIRSDESGYDAVIDFDLALQDPNATDTMLRKYANDNLHPNEAGYRQLGNCIDLNLFKD